MANAKGLLQPFFYGRNAAFSCKFTNNMYARLFSISQVNFYRKKKVKVRKPPRLIQFIEAGATQEEIDNFVNTRAARRKATADYKEKMAAVASIFREELRIEEERKKDIAGEQMKKEAEEKLQEAKNLSIILQSNEELHRER